ncbi:hypothetical protein D9M71_640390 [compost metagenome]
MPGTQVIDGKIDDFGHRAAVGKNQHMQRCRQLHEAGNDTAVDGRKNRVADVVGTCRQAEQQFVTLAVALDADQPGIRNQRQQRRIVAMGMGVVQRFAQILAFHERPPRVARGAPTPTLILLPKRMKVPTTWAIGWVGSSW